MFTKETIYSYFTAYKQAHVFLCIVAIVAIIAAAILYWFLKKEFYKGVAVGIVGLAVLYGTYGFVQYKQANRLQGIDAYNYDLHPEYLKRKALPRLNSVEKNITIIGIVHIFLLAVGLYYSKYYFKKIKYLSGIFVGICCMSSIAIYISIFINIKTHNYQNNIIEFTKKIKNSL